MDPSYSLFRLFIDNRISIVKHRVYHIDSILIHNVLVLGVWPLGVSKTSKGEEPAARNTLCFLKHNLPLELRGQGQGEGQGDLRAEAAKDGGRVGTH